MIVVVRADTGEMMLHLDARGMQLILISDAREHQQLWRENRACADDDFPAGGNLSPAAIVQHTYSAGATIVDRDLKSTRPCQNSQLRPTAGEAKICGRGGYPASVLNRTLARPVAFRARTVEIRIACIAQALHGL